MTRFAIPGLMLVVVLVMLTSALLQGSMLWTGINTGLLVYCIIWLGWERRRGPRNQ